MLGITDFISCVSHFVNVLHVEVQPPFFPLIAPKGINKVIKAINKPELNTDTK